MPIPTTGYRLWSLSLLPCIPYTFALPNETALCHTASRMAGGVARVGSQARVAWVLLCSKRTVSDVVYEQRAEEWSG